MGLHSVVPVGTLCFESLAIRIPRMRIDAFLRLSMGTAGAGPFPGKALVNLILRVGSSLSALTATAGSLTRDDRVVGSKNSGRTIQK